MSVIVTIAGVDKTSLIDWESFTVEQQVTNQIDSAHFTIKKYGTKNYAPTEGDTVLISDSGVEIFGGTILNVANNVKGTLTVFDVTAVSHERTLDRYLVSREITSQPARYILNTIIADFVNRVSKIVDSGETTETWTQEDGTVATTTTTGEYIYGSQGKKFTATVSSTATGRSASSVDLSKFDDGSAFGNSDLFKFWVKVDNANNLASVRVRVGCDSGSTYTNYYEATILVAALANGWNEVTIAKSAFASHGSPSWDSVLKRQYRVTASAGGTVNVCIDDVRLVQAMTYFSQTGVDNADSPILGSAKFNYEQVSDAIKQIADAVGNDWYIDPDRVLQFYQPSTISAPFSLTDSSQNFIWDSLTTTDDLSTIKNQVYVRGGEYQGSNTSYDQTADGNALNFRSPYKIKNLTIAVNGVSKTVGIDNIDDPASFYALYNFEEKNLKFPIGNKPANGDVVNMTGNPMIPVIVKRGDATSIATHGVFEHVIIDKSITTLQGARDRAAAELRNYRDTLVEGGFKTDTVGLRAGQTISIAITSRGINETFIIQTLTYTMKSPTEMYYEAKLVSTRSFGIIDYLLTLLRNERKQIDINDSESVDLVQDIAETVTTTDAWTQKTTNAQAETITPSDSESDGLNQNTIFVLAPYTHANFADTKRAFILDGSPLGSGTVVPSDIANLELWLEFDYGVSQSGGVLDSITDRSSNGYVFTGSGSARPTVNASGINSMQTADFDGVNDMITHPSLHLTGAQTWIFVYKNDALPSTAQALMGSSNGANLSLIDQIIFGGYQPYSIELDYNSGTLIGIADSPGTSPQSLAIRYDGGGASTPADYAIARNGVDKTVVASSSTDPGSGWPTGMTLGARPSGLAPLQGKLAAVLAFSRRLTDGELTSMLTYLGRWGV